MRHKAYVLKQTFNFKSQKSEEYETDHATISHVFYLMMIVHGITMPDIKAYEIVLEIDGQESCITLDDTFPAIEWMGKCLQYGSLDGKAHSPR